MPFCKDMQQATQGRVKCNLLPKAVVAPPQTFDAVRDGLADLSFSVHGYTPGRFVADRRDRIPVPGRHLGSHLGRLPAHPRPHARQARRAQGRAGAGACSPTARARSSTPSAPINSLKDLEGMKIRVGGGMVERHRQGARHRADAQARAGKLRAVEPGRGRRRVLPEGSRRCRSSSCRCIKHVTFVPGGLYNVSFGMVMNPAKWKQISRGRPGGDQQAHRRGAGAPRRQGLGCDRRARREGDAATPTSRS